jgi:signal peptidase I
LSRAEQEPGGRDGGGIVGTPDDDSSPLRPGDDFGSDPSPETGPGQTRGERRRLLKRQKRTSFFREFPVLIIIAFLLALLIKTFFVQAFWIPSASMERTLLINDRVLVNKLVYDFRDPRKGDIVVFNGDGTGFESSETTVAPPSNPFARVMRDISGALGLGAPSEKDFIKRVIGVGGDTVACCDAQNRVLVNGKAINESYLFEDNAMKFGPVTVPKGYLWVMGDHRGDSQDSRFNGPIPVNKVVGRAFVRVWPLSRIGFLSAPNIYGAGSPAVTGGALAGAALLVPVAGLRRRRPNRPGPSRRRRGSGRPRGPAGSGRRAPGLGDTSGSGTGADRP